MAWISMRTEENRLVLSYNHRRNGGERQDVEQPVPIIRVPCRLGGHRPYFRCPGVLNGVPCRRRVAKLYGADRYFLCRHCYRLAYASQTEGEWDRAMRRSDKIRLRLGGNPGLAAPFPQKPKGMWWRTYERLQDRTCEAEAFADEAFLNRAQRLLSRLDKPKRERGIWT